MHGWRNPSALFDLHGYLADYADVAAANVNPLTHYDMFGRHEGRANSRCASGYSPDWMALSSRKRIAPSLLLSEITKRMRPCLEVSA